MTFILNWSLGRPRFINIPTNISASAGNNVTFACTAFAVPEAVITWSHTSLSGVERSLNTRTNVQIVGSTITVSNVEYFQDGGKYTCTASNNHGSIKTDAHLNLDCECSRTSVCYTYVCNCPLHQMSKFRLFYFQLCT